MELLATSIGTVRKPEDGVIFIEIKDEFWDATLQMDKFSHHIVLWWITGRDNDEARKNLQGYPPYDDVPLSGIFATRSPSRPTPVGLTIVQTIKIDEDKKRIYLDQIDAEDGTPVIDIKPYMPFSDKVDGAKVPEWFDNNTSRYSDNPLG